MLKCNDNNKPVYNFPKKKEFRFNNRRMFQTVNYKIYCTIFHYKSHHRPIPNSSQNLVYTTFEGIKDVGGYSMAVVNCDHNFVTQETFVGEFAMEKFLEKIIDTHQYLYDEVVNTNIDKIITPELWQEYHQATQCPYCKQEYGSNGWTSKRCFHHHHMSGIFQKNMVI